MMIIVRGKKTPQTHLFFLGVLFVHYNVTGTLQNCTSLKTDIFNSRSHYPHKNKRCIPKNKRTNRKQHTAYKCTNKHCSRHTFETQNANLVTEKLKPMVKSHYRCRVTYCTWHSAVQRSSATASVCCEIVSCVCKVRFIQSWPAVPVHKCCAYSMKRRTAIN